MIQAPPPKTRQIFTKNKTNFISWKPRHIKPQIKFTHKIKHQQEKYYHRNVCYDFSTCNLFKKKAKIN